jgi:hypothetical protein
MRLSAIIAIALTASVLAPATADRIILAPTGNVKGLGDVTAEAAISPSNNDAKIYWLNVGLPRIELSGIRFDSGSGAAGADQVDSFGAEFSLLPETTLTPGVGIGVWDMKEKTDDGRGYYLALSKELPIPRHIPTPIKGVRVHAGFGASGLSGIFGGAEATIPLGLTLSAEYFQKKFNFAIGWKPLPLVQGKVYLLDGETYYGIEVSTPL